MVDTETQKLENDLRDRMMRFVDGKSQWNSLCRSVLQKIHDYDQNHYYDQNSFLCGGAVRDILLSNEPNVIIPRDLDIIFWYGDIKEIANSFAGYVKRWNCYGGLSIQIRDWSFDLWQLEDTWAFKEKHVAVKGIADFPKTTFLNIDAVAIQLFAEKGKRRSIYSKGFFEAILQKTIEINFEDNPNPTMCIVRSLRISSRHRFLIGRKLAKYIVHYANQVEPEELLKLYQARYQSPFVSVDEICSYIKSIKEQVKVSNGGAVRLPVSKKGDYFYPALWSVVPTQDEPHRLCTRIGIKHVH